jgi:hypothetical protein
MRATKNDFSVFNNEKVAKNDYEKFTMFGRTVNIPKKYDKDFKIIKKFKHTDSFGSFENQMGTLRIKTKEEILFEKVLENRNKNNKIKDNDNRDFSKRKNELSVFIYYLIK